MYWWFLGTTFSPELTTNWPHKHECLRLTYTRDQSVVEKGLAILADEVSKLYEA